MRNDEIGCSQNVLPRANVLLADAGPHGLLADALLLFLRVSRLDAGNLSGGGAVQPVRPRRASGLPPTGAQPAVLSLRYEIYSIFLICTFSFME